MYRPTISQTARIQESQEEVTPAGERGLVDLTPGSRHRDRERSNQSLASDWTVSELLERCSRQPCDNVAWEEFVRRFHPTIKSNVFKTFHNKAREDFDRRPQFPDDLIEDLVQGVYSRLIEDSVKALQRFQGEHANSIYEYLKMISINVVRDHFREVRAQKRPKVSHSLDELLDAGDVGLLRHAVSGLDGQSLSGSDPPITRDEIDRILRKAVSGKNRDRDILIFQLRFYEGLTLEEIAKVTGNKLSAISVGSILNRTIKKMKRIMELEGDRR
ncbi:MAG TPA: sigma-70 family RNA polymerase sigma factor [Blastocatellia bacterium]|nr:sigma-70 family RNA polymerase sigma factor [Blastocatellia bacterium]